MCNHRWKWEREIYNREARDGERADVVIKDKRLITTDMMKCRKCGELRVDGFVPPHLREKVNYMLRPAHSEDKEGVE